MRDNTETEWRRVMDTGHWSSGPRVTTHTTYLRISKYLCIRYLDISTSVDIMSTRLGREEIR